jgi:glycine/sarcosine N-methyltransferase
MAVFNDFTAVYDQMFPWEGRWRKEGPFFRRLLDACGARSVLDCACGPGRHAVEFARWGLVAAGSDLAPNMIAAAETHAREAGVAVDLRAASFIELAAAWGEARFDAVICLGNSLCLAPDDAGVARALAEMSRVLTPVGVAVVHVFNWDKLAVQGLRIMPAAAAAVDGRDVTLLRVFHHRGEVVDLHLVAVARGEAGAETQIQTAAQRAVGPARLAEYARTAGFRTVETFAGYDRAPFDPAVSDQLVMVLNKE